MQKSLKQLALDWDEETYRNSNELHYSTIAKFAREGFEHIDTLFDKIESPSLLLGSLVDCLTTDPPEEYDRRYLVAEFPAISDTIINIVKLLFDTYSEIYDTIYKIPDNAIIDITEATKYQLNWKPETRAKVIREKAADYYNLLYLAKDKIIISTELNDLAHEMANSLITSPQTSTYFVKEFPFEDKENLYQLKFRADIGGVGYVVMFDIIQIDYDNKTIQPIDVKTSYKPSYNFYKSFIEWGYSHQCRLYYQVLKRVIEKDNYFKDFKILDYKDIVISKSNMLPLVWEFTATSAEGTLIYGKHNQIELKAPWEIGKELKMYLDNNAVVPKGININKSNDIIKWINANM